MNMRLKNIIWTLGMGLCLVFSAAAQRPSSQVYAFKLGANNGNIALSEAQFLTQFNLTGYNNQPHWVNNNELYISAQVAPDSVQTDIYSLSLIYRTLVRVTATAEAEYSPVLMPDRTQFSCVRVDAGPVKNQRLWAYPLSRRDTGRDLLPLHTNIGYYFWVNAQTVAAFVLTERENRLKLIRVNDQSSVELGSNIGRAFGRLPDGRLVFLQKEGAQKWMLKALDTDTYATEELLPSLPLSEDFTIMADGTFLAGSGSKLYTYKYGDLEKKWTEVADLSAFGVTNIKRLAVNADGDRLALVQETIPK